MAVAGKEGYYSGYRIVLAPGGEVLFQLTYSTRHTQTSPGAFTPDEWHYLVGTYDGTAMQIYVDGVVRKTVPADGPIDSAEAPMLAGSTNLQYYLDGRLDELRLSSVPRSPAWIALQWASMTGELVTVGDEQPI